MLAKLYLLICDQCGRWSATNGFATSALARRHAKRQGWGRSATYSKPIADWCSRCMGRSE